MDCFGEAHEVGVWGGERAACVAGGFVWRARQSDQRSGRKRAVNRKKPPIFLAASLLARVPLPLPFPNKIRELKQRRRRRQRERQKRNRFRSAKQQLCTCITLFLYISLPSLHDYNVKVPNFTFCRGREHKTTFLFFS